MESYLDLTRLTLRLGEDWKIDQVLPDEQKEQVDIYISHLGGALVCPETGEPGTLYDHRKERLGVTWIATNSSVLSIVGFRGSSHRWGCER